MSYLSIMFTFTYITILHWSIILPPEELLGKIIFKYPLISTLPIIQAEGISLNICHIINVYWGPILQEIMSQFYLYNFECVISACLHSRMAQLLHQTVFQVTASLFCHSVCCICGKILYPSSAYWLIDIPLDENRA